jgi:hypothetical protein
MLRSSLLSTTEHTLPDLMQALWQLLLSQLTSCWRLYAVQQLAVVCQHAHCLLHV